MDKLKEESSNAVAKFLKKNNIEDFVIRSSRMRGLDPISHLVQVSAVLSYLLWKGKIILVDKEAKKDEINDKGSRK